MGFFNNDPRVSDMNAVEAEIRAAKRSGAFTSDLSGQEFWLVVDKGYVPVGLVLGNSVFSMGIGGGIATAFRGLARGELKELTQLMYDARGLALARMKQEADQLGADGIIGVDIQINHHGDVMEVTAVGTAVKKDPNAASKPSTAQVVIST